MDAGRRRFVKRELTVFLIFFLFGIAPFIVPMFFTFGISLTWDLRIGMISFVVIALYPVYLVIDILVWIIKKIVGAIRKK
ncbi:MAG: hypothetical protein ABID83_04130 [Candidatus Omnitrophota bacterium]